MTTPDTATPAPAEDPLQLPRRTTPTWEMELLISGATVFGLLQLPDLADRLMFGLSNASAMETSGLVIALWVYAKFSLLTLIGTFILHLVLRGHWVALVGLHSVYPLGIRWDRMAGRMGPHYLATSRECSGGMGDLIERADNRASRVFGVGFGLAAVMLMPMVLVSLAIAAVWLYLALGGAGGETATWVVMASFLVVFLPFGLLVGWDRSRGAKVAAASPQGRWLRRGFRFYGALGFNRTSNPLLMLFASNEGGRLTGWLMGTLMALMMAVVSVQAFADRLGWSFGDYRGLPEDKVQVRDVLLDLHYASRRGEAVVLVPPPHIPDPVVRGRYLELFVPYLPARHNLAMQRRCPETLARQDEAGDRSRLDCLAALHDVRIDGQPANVRFDAAQDRQTGQRGLVAMIPVDALAPGRHELTVMPATERGRRPVTESTPPYRIPFWR